MLRWCVALVVFAACSEPQATGDQPQPSDHWPSLEVRYTTEHLAVATAFTQPVCRGSLEVMERHVVRIAQAIEIEPPQVTVFWFNDVAQGADLSIDEGDCFPCFKNGAVYSDSTLMLHELVHGTLSPVLGRSHVFLGEGIADGFNGSHIALEPSLALPSVQFGSSQRGSPSFIRWVLDSQGGDTVQNLLGSIPYGASQSDAVMTLEEVMGMDVGAIEAEFLAEAAAVYPAPWLCDDLPLVPWNNGRWEVHEPIDCDASNVFGPADLDPVNTLSVLIEVSPTEADQPLTVEYDIDAPAAKLTSCLTTPSDDEYHLVQPAISPVLSLSLREGLYRVDIPDPGNGRADVGLVLP